MHQSNPFFLISLFILLTILSRLIQAQNSSQDFVDVHNTARAMVGVGPITWDPIVAAFAENYVQGCLADCNMVHTDQQYGENLAHGTDLTGQGAVQFWVEEKPNYDHELNTCVGGNECGHYTQVVWRDSVRLGCARAQCANGEWYVSCNYDPQGNVHGQSPY